MITTTAATTPDRSDRAGMIVIIVLAVAIVWLMARPVDAPVCVPAVVTVEGER